MAPPRRILKTDGAAISLSAAIRLVNLRGCRKEIFTDSPFCLFQNTCTLFNHPVIDVNMFGETYLISKESMTIIPKSQ
jgi:hypothetical protein